MNEDRCSFSEPLLNSGFGCSCATPVTRRAGPDIACRSSAAAKQCGALLEAFKSVGLPVFGCEDDLLTMPHSVLMKIKAGGLLGLKALVDGGNGTTVDDIAGLVERAVTNFGEVTGIPCDRLTDDMEKQSVRRRSTRRESR